MKRSASILVLLMSSTSVLAVAFTNCSHVNFQTSQAAMDADKQQLSSSSSVLIDNGAEFSNQKALQLSLVSPRANAMKLSTQAGCSDGTWESYESLRSQTVTTPNQTIAVYAQFKDIMGNETGCVSDDIIHDDQPPTGAILNPSGAFSKDASLLVKWTMADSLSGIGTVECQDPAGVKVSCVDSMSVANKTEGSNSVRVKIKDKAGNVAPDLVYSYVYDKTAPVISINGQPASLTGSTTANIVFSGEDAISGVASFACNVDGKISGCVSPVALAGLTEGSHHFELTATDKAGNVSLAKTFDWKVDLTAPAVTLTQTPAANTNSSTAPFAFTAVDDGKLITAFQCSLDGGGYSACPSPKTYSGVSDGSHTFRVTATDTAGNQSQPTSYTWLVDTKAPVVTITAGPTGLSNIANPTFAWTATDAGSGLKSVACVVDGGSSQPCASFSLTLANLQEGAHSLVVTATDTAGNTGSATRAWTTDTVAPVLTLTSHPDAVTAKSVASFGFSATDANGIANFECRTDTSAFAVCTSAYSLPTVTNGAHIFYVRATDKASNVSLITSYSWLADLSAPVIVTSAPATVQQGSDASVQYTVADPDSGLASVQCGLTSPVNTFGSCDAVTTARLGALSTVGAYTFKIVATDKVGNVATEIVTIQVTTKPTVCDPFDKAAESLCNGGLLGNIYYLTGTARTNFVAGSTKTVDTFYSTGIKVENLLNLKTINVPERNFSSGFPATDGSTLKDNNGGMLTEYFAFRLSTIVKLDPADTDPTFNKEGWYQVAMLSDDGSVINYQPSATDASVNLVSNDGDHSVRMGCSAKAIYLKDSSRLPFEIKYYQGPASEVGLVLMWRKVASETAALDANCGITDRTGFFGEKFDDFTNSRYGTLVNKNGWKVMGAGNFIAPATIK